MFEGISNADWFKKLNLELEKEQKLRGGHSCLQYTRSFWDFFNDEYHKSCQNIKKDLTTILCEC
jgi:hypothetical protein